MTPPIEDLIKVYTNSIFVAASRGELTETGISTTLKMLANKVKESEQPEPRTKTEYVKCEFSDTMGMIDGDICIDSDLYFEWSSKHVVPISEVSARDLIMNRHKLVRKAEKEIDWREEVNDFFLKTEDLGTDHLIANGIEMKELGSDFIKMCRLVESLTRHIEI